MGYLEAIAAFLRSLPEIIGLIKDLVAFVQNKHDLLELTNSLKALTKAIQEAKASTIAPPGTAPGTHTGNTSAIEAIFNHGGKP